LGLGSIEVGLKLLHLDVTHKKSETQNPNFFIADMKTCQVFWGFEQLSSAIVSRDIPTQTHVQTAGFLRQPPNS